jgi:hypothetical protein
VRSGFTVAPLDFCNVSRRFVEFVAKLNYRVHAALQARTLFSKHGPSWAKTLPLTYEECEKSPRSAAVRRVSLLISELRSRHGEYPADRRKPATNVIHVYLSPKGFLPYPLAASFHS